MPTFNPLTVTPGSGFSLDLVLVSGNNREVHVVGDPNTQAALAAVENADPGSTDYGMVVRDVRGNVALPVRTDPTGTTTQPVSGTVAFSNTTIAVTNTGTFAVQATLSAETTKVIGTVNQGTSPWTIQGDSASGAAKAGNPVQVGGVFNTTQPTVSAGQTVEAQMTARGAQIVAPGVDNFAVQATLAAETTKVIGTVNQGTSPWVVSLASTTVTNTVAENLTQVAGTALGATAVTNFGTAPAAAAVPGVNSSLFVGTTGVRSNQTTTATGVVDVNLVGVLGATMSATNPAFASITDGTTKAGVIAGTTALKTDLSSVAGTATVTAAAGVQKVGIVGNANATLDGTVAAGTAPTNALAQLVQYTSAANVPALTTAQTVSAQSDVTGGMYVNPEGRRKTYSAMTPIASAAGVTGFIAFIPGNATTTVRVTRVEVTLSTTGTAAIEQVQLIKLSSAPTGQTSVNMVIVPHDANFAAASSQPLAITVASTGGGAAVGPIRCAQFFDESSTVSGSATWIWEFGGVRGASAIVLRGTAQCLAVNLGATVATQTAIVSIEWIEDNS